MFCPADYTYERLNLKSIYFDNSFMYLYKLYCVNNHMIKKQELRSDEA